MPPAKLSLPAEETLASVVINRLPQSAWSPPVRYTSSYEQCFSSVDHEGSTAVEFSSIETPTVCCPDVFIRAGIPDFSYG